MAKRLTKKALIATFTNIDNQIGIEGDPIDETKNIAGYGEELHETIVALELTEEEIKGLDAESQEVIATLKEKHVGEAPVVEEEVVEEVEEEVEEEEKPKRGGTQKAETEKTAPDEAETKVKKFTAADYNRVDALSEAIKGKKKFKTQDEWSDEANALLEAKGGTVKPNSRENRFTIGYFVKIAKHFDLGELPPKK